MDTAELQQALKDEQAQARAAERAAQTVALAHGRHMAVSHAYARALIHLALSQKNTPERADELMAENAALITDWLNTVRGEFTGPRDPREMPLCWPRPRHWSARNSTDPGHDRKTSPPAGPHPALLQ